MQSSHDLRVWTEDFGTARLRTIAPLSGCVPSNQIVMHRSSEAAASVGVPALALSAAVVCLLVAQVIVCVAL